MATNRNKEAQASKIEQLKKDAEKLGKYDVTLEVHYLDGEVVTEDVFAWEHVNAYIALTMYDGSFKVLCIQNARYFTVKNNKSLIVGTDDKLN